MSGNSGGPSSGSRVEEELYFLIARFLDRGPCRKAAEALRREVEENQLLPKRLDWEGQNHQRSFENLIEANRHISQDHLLQIVKRVGPLLDKEIPPCVSGVASLLGAGRQSLLRTEEEVNSPKWPEKTWCVVRHGKPLKPPLTMKQAPNFIHAYNAWRFSGMARPQELMASTLFNKLTMHKRSLGHLSAVYCVAYDRTGKYIFTGADDHLVKIWSALDGRLLATLRGHAAEITDMTVNFENTLLASGSCDKCIRVWCLKTTAPIAVLQGHTSMITSIQFCPLVRGDTRFLASTGGDGCVCFWQWNVVTNTFNHKPIKFIERSRAGAQMLCSSFSPGGYFLATGSSDHVIRIYDFIGPQPEKVSELESHSDRVDSICYSNHGDRFVSGSRDGTARIWRYERQDWKAIMLNMCNKTINSISTMEGDDKTKYKVTMVAWNTTDDYVVTAVSDCSIKIWDSHNGKLLHMLEAHTEEVFVLEGSPKDPRVFLSAGHDGHIILWDIQRGIKLKSFFNSIEGQGHGAVFDCKFAPDGYSVAATDSHGHLLMFGFGSGEHFKKVPSEVFYHTDYRPLMRDSNNYVLDEQTQQPPHLMPPPFLVDMDGNPHLTKYQRLVPGRERMKEEALIPQMGDTPSGDREVLDQAVFSPEPQGPEGTPRGQEGTPRADMNLDDIILRMQQEQDRHNHIPTSPPPQNRTRSRLTSGNRGPRRTGEVEGVRQATGDVPVSQRATQRDLAAWSKRVVVGEVDPAVLKHCEDRRQLLAEEEIKKFVTERRKKPVVLDGTDSSDSGFHRVRTRKRQDNRRTRTRERAAQNEETGRNRLTTRALYDTEEEEMSEGDTSDPEVAPDDAWDSDKTEGSESSDYSDWTPDAGMNLQPPKRSRRLIKRNKKYSESDQEDDDGHEDEKVNIEDDDDEATEIDEQHKEERPVKKKKTLQPKTRPRRKKTTKQQHLAIQGSPQELPEEFRPPEWLTGTIPRKAPYVPQMGDEVIYFFQGHQVYVNAVKNHKAYDINPNKGQPWHKLKLREQELTKIIGIKYEVKPPRLCCLKLAIIEPDGKMTGNTFTIKYHDMPDVIDFIVLRPNYDLAMSRNWKPGMRFRSMIDDCWWMGKIDSHEPYQEEYPDSQFQCLLVTWDNREKERMSPWDLEPINKKYLPSEVGSSIPVSAEELKSLMFTPKDSEWPPCGRNRECSRIAHGLETIMNLSIAEYFSAPVDLNAIPLYGICIAYPIDLNTIKERVENHFYRRVTSILFDVRYIESNAKAFNQPNSLIVRKAALVTDLCLRFINDSECQDPMPLYHDLIADADLAEDANGANEESDEFNGDTVGTRKRTRRKKNKPVPTDPHAWLQECGDLLETMFECDDSKPFRHPVDPLEYPDYRAVIEVPMDLGSVREQYQADCYNSPMEFAKDVRLIFSNAKQFTPNKKTRIYSMTLRMSAMFENYIEDIISDWNYAKKHAKKDKGTKPCNKKFVRRKSKRSMGSNLSAKKSYESTSGPSTGHNNDVSSTSLSQEGAGCSGISTRSRFCKSKAQKFPESSGSDTEDYDADNNEKADTVTRKPILKLKIKRSNGAIVTNGHNNNSRYATRCATGSLKPKKLTSSDSDEEPEKDNDVTIQHSESELEHSGTSSSSESESDPATPFPSLKRKRVHQEPSSENDDSDSDVDYQHNTRASSRIASKSTLSSRVNNNSSIKSPSKRKASYELDDTYLASEDENRRSRKRGKRTTRNQGKRTVHYAEDSAEDLEHLDNEYETGTSVSRSGRTRRLTARARAHLVGV
ncbi:unnamed protein product [Owenia fusiformis]|uniref:Bromo domain-containing protein n=1 Tax=Owenia fusiformis TaxID=6347 RepID=A0A8S4Q4S6_OWEFU|nr:unnamed protein product [Owenia fusiformis]